MAAILNSFPRAIILPPGPTSGRRASAEVGLGDRARGRSPLAGGAAAWAVPAVLAGARRVNFLVLQPRLPLQRKAFLVRLFDALRIRLPSSGVASGARGKYE